MLLADQLAAQFGTKLLINGGGQEPSWDDNPEALLGYTVLRDFTNSLPRLYGISVFDCATALGRPEAPWRFIDGVTDDGTHANSVGEELLVTIVKPALQKSIGKSGKDECYSDRDVFRGKQSNAPRSRFSLFETLRGIVGRLGL